MGFLFTGTFWGVFLILIGITVLVRVFFNIDLPIIRIFFGVLIIAIGINILFGRSMTWKETDTIMFGEGEFKSSGNRGEYTVVFGRGITDLTDLKKDTNEKIEINTIFGENIVYLKKGIPISVKASSAFGQIDFPDGNNAVFGSYNYTSPEFKKDKPYVRIEMNTVFGSTRVKFKD
jgi:predicted membrane protein